MPLLGVCLWNYFSEILSLCPYFQGRILLWSLMQSLIMYLCMFWPIITWSSDTAEDWMCLHILVYSLVPLPWNEKSMSQLASGSVKDMRISAAITGPSPYQFISSWPTVHELDKSSCYVPLRYYGCLLYDTDTSATSMVLFLK